jgi:hypothetical protein
MFISGMLDVSGGRGFGNGGEGFGPGLDDIKEVVDMDEGVGFLVDNYIDCRPEIIIHLLPEVHPAFVSESGEYAGDRNESR